MSQIFDVYQINKRLSELMSQEYICKIEVFIRKDGVIHRHVFPLGPYDEEKDKSGYYDSLRYEYPAGGMNSEHAGDCIYVWPIVKIPNGSYKK